MFVNFSVSVCLFKRQGSIPNESISIWNASLSLKHANKHSKINKQTNFFFVYSTLKKIAKMQNCKIAKSDKKNAGVDDALKEEEGVINFYNFLLSPNGSNEWRNIPL